MSRRMRRIPLVPCVLAPRPVSLTTPSMAGGVPWVGRAAVTVVLAATSVLLAACQAPNFHGPQIQNPPAGYVPSPDLEQERRMFPDLALVHHDAWIEGSVQEAGSIHINGHHGSLGAEAVQAARDAAAAVAPDDLTVGGLERLVVDGRQAWGWSEELTAPDGSVLRLAYRVAVAYDTVTYTAELDTSEPRMTAQPDSVRAVVASFAVGETTWNLPALAVVAGALLLGLRMLRVRADRKAEHLRTITLAKVPNPSGRDPTATQDEERTRV